MDLGLRPIDIARKLGISTTALRHYEEWGFTPPVEREPNGYRIYTKRHEAYFACIRAMNDGFGMKRTGQVLKEVLKGKIDDALWLVSETQAASYRDKVVAEKTIRALQEDDIGMPPPSRKGEPLQMTIGQVSALSSVPDSAIRHWEKTGLLTIGRNPENGYRIFNEANVRQVLLIRTLKAAVWSLDVIHQMLHEIDQDQVDNAIRTAREALDILNYRNRMQYRGVARLQLLLEEHEPGGAIGPNGYC